MPFDQNAHGVYAITATPFHPDGRLDFQSVATMTDSHLRCGVCGLSILGML